MPRSAPLGPPPALGPASSAWLARTVVTGVCMLGALVAGLLLGLFGLVGIAAVIAIGLVLIAAGPWRRAALPLAAVAAALSLGGLLSTRSGSRVALSVGNRVEGIAPGQLRSGRASFRQGFGSLAVDLRDADLRPGTTTDLHLRSDVGTVVVALDRRVCTTVHLRWRQLEVNPVADELQNWRRAASLSGSTEVSAGNLFLPNLFSAEHPDNVRGVLGGDAADATLVAIGGRYAGGPSIWFGQSQSRVLTGRRGAFGGLEFDPRDGIGRQYRLTREAARPDAAVVNLDIQAGSGFIVRDYPDTVELDPANEVGGVSWPENEMGGQFSTDPDQPSVTFGRIHRSADARRRWSRWEQRWVRAARRRAVLAAGSCATHDQLRDHWALIGYAYDGHGTAGHLLAVNGLGELVAKSASGAPPATGSAARLARLTDTTAISEAVQRERLRTYRAANLPQEAR